MSLIKCNQVVIKYSTTSQLLNITSFMNSSHDILINFFFFYIIPITFTEITAIIKECKTFLVSIKKGIMINRFLVITKNFHISLECLL
jgi:hypothetical protein